eukprot:CAMPEP_0183519626 /NCGR_PEP_ID=MMETSP0371-20130417/16268_1 /TAXON_ID=268820 /ORGANISM="Peridinium aciculiferum, Strain PAER-2" /LENGTH=413 /DNA_ID=CAMNT_0025717807 /DNA_START=1 /DNA_END=1242 /DNA_ORIENTATION=-
MLNLKDIIKASAVADPDMWGCVQRAVRVAIDSIWKDLEMEVERKLEKALLKQKAVDEQESPQCGRWGCCCACLRAFLLRHFLPFDRSIFGKMKDPVFWIITILVSIPMYGLRAGVFSLMLLMLVLPGPPDEYQFIDYILQLKGSQFFTVGILQTLITGGTYFYCASWRTDALPQCIRDHGPGSSQVLLWSVIDYISNVLLCWFAFWALPFSVKSSQGTFVVAPKYKASKQEKESDTEGGQTDDGGGDGGCCCCCAGHDHAAGGRLRTLLFYDMICFLITLSMLAFITYLTGFDVGKGVGQGDQEPGLSHDPQFKANLFMARVLYSLLTFPFAIFLVPLLSTLLTHCDPTGFNANGACVPFMLPATGLRKGEKVGDEGSSDEESLESTSAAVDSDVEGQQMKASKRKGIAAATE